MLNGRKDDGTAMRVRKSLRRMMCGSLGILISGLMGITGVEAALSEFSQKSTGSIENLVLVAQSRGNDENRRDPFRPINKPRARSAPSKKSQSAPKKTLPIQQVKVPKFMLLGIIHGPFGRQAVIQVSPGKRMFARSGLELAQSGWFIKTINKGEVLLEHFPTTSSRASLFQPQTFILSFPAHRTSQ